MPLLLTSISFDEVDSDGDVCMDVLEYNGECRSRYITQKEVRELIKFLQDQVKNYDNRSAR